jgi:hypothetical protein
MVSEEDDFMSTKLIWFPKYCKKSDYKSEALLSQLFNKKKKSVTIPYWIHFKAELTGKVEPCSVTLNGLDMSAKLPHD